MTKTEMSVWVGQKLFVLVLLYVAFSWVAFAWRNDYMTTMQVFKSFWDAVAWK